MEVRQAEQTHEGGVWVTSLILEMFHMFSKPTSHETHEIEEVKTKSPKICDVIGQNPEE